MLTSLCYSVIEVTWHYELISEPVSQTPPEIKIFKINTGSVQGQAGWSSEQPGLVRGVPVHSMEIEQDH